MSDAKTFQDWSKEILPIVEAAANGAVIEFKQAGVWHEKILNDLCYAYDYRVKPKTIRIGEYDVPAPMTVAPAIGAPYYAAVNISKILYSASLWGGTPMEMLWLQYGILHSTKEAAILHTTALLSLTKVGV